MHPGQVVVLLEVLGTQLPVGPDIDDRRVAGAPVLELVAGQPVAQVAEPLTNRWGIVVEGGEQQAAELFNPDGMEAVVSRVETIDGHLVEAGGGHKLAVPVVGPPVVRAADGRSEVAVRFEEFGAAVSTGVGKAPQVAGLVANHDHRAGPDRPDQSPAIGPHFIGGAYAHPRRVEHPFLFKTVEAVVGVGLPGQR